MTHGVIGNTSDFGSAESWFEPRWVNKQIFDQVASTCLNAARYFSLFPDSTSKEYRQGMLPFFIPDLTEPPYIIIKKPGTKGPGCIDVDYTDI